MKNWLYLCELFPNDMTIPAHIQMMIDQGFAYEDSDGCVRLLPAYCSCGLNMPNIHIHVHNHYYNNHHHNIYDSQVAIGQFVEYN